MTDTMWLTPDKAVPDVQAYEDLRARLFIPLGVSGVRASTGLFEDVIDGVNRLVTRLRPSGAEVMRFPPVLPRTLLEKSGYLRSFPHQLGCICSLGGSEREISRQIERFYAGEGDWTEGLETGDLVLSPAACLPVYPLVAARGTVPATGLRFDVSGACFRREPSHEVGRLQSFRQREFVYVGAREGACAFRDEVLQLGQYLADALDLPHRVVTASDPFFGGASRVLALLQKQKTLKHELQVPLAGENNWMACLSSNYHEDHYGQTWDIRVDPGEVAHSACLGLGIDRLAIAAFIRHGTDLATWPASVRDHLGL